MRILVTTANGMFGGALVRRLAERGADVRAMVRDRARFSAAFPAMETVAADLDRPSTLGPAMAGVDRVFLCTPMDPRLGERECAVIEAAEAAGASLIVKLHGAVRHDDHLSGMHARAIERLQTSKVPHCLVSPNSVMETSLLGFADSIREEGKIYGMSGHGRIGFVALDDVAEAAAVLLTEGRAGGNFELTGPQSLDLYDAAEIFTEALGRKVEYEDMSEEAMVALMTEVLPFSAEELEINVLCHLRCWRDGKADLVTDTFSDLTGKPPTSLLQWVRERTAVFGKEPHG